jgi:thiol-disulfide isomerase/thioredoxin
MKIKLIGGILLAVLLIFGINKFLRNKIPPKMGFNAAQLKTVDDNKKITINDYLGKVVIVSCFQTWCSDCAQETPILNQLATKINNPNFQVIYITDEGSEKLPSFRNRLASDKILFTYSEKSLESLGIYVYPTTFLINAKGDVVKTKLEGYDWLKDEVEIKNMIEN